MEPRWRRGSRAGRSIGRAGAGGAVEQWRPLDPSRPGRADCPPRSSSCWRIAGEGARSSPHEVEQLPRARQIAASIPTFPCTRPGCENGSRQALPGKFRHFQKQSQAPAGKFRHLRVPVSAWLREGRRCLGNSDIPTGRKMSESCEGRRQQGNSDIPTFARTKNTHIVVRGEDDHSPVTPHEIDHPGADDHRHTRTIPRNTATRRGRFFTQAPRMTGRSSPRADDPQGAEGATNVAAPGGGWACLRAARSSS